MQKAATGSHDNTARLWDTATGKELRTLSGHTDHVTSVAFSPVGKLVATGSKDKTFGYGISPRAKSCGRFRGTLTM